MSATSTHIPPTWTQQPHLGHVLTIEEAWALTRAISPRDFVQAARPGDSVTNNYPLVVPLDGPAPVSAWAMLLTDNTGDFRFLAFDFDAGGDPDAAVAHAAAFSALLDERPIPHVVCASGRPGGRHVWVALHDPVDSSNVKNLAKLTKIVFPSLDTSPLSNDKTGAVRPPGALHRFASSSTVLGGNLEVLKDPWVSFDDVAWLLERIRTLVDTTIPLEPRGIPSLGIPMPVDEDGHLHLPGPRGPLPAVARTALDRHIDPGMDASAIAWTILLGCVRAGWHHRDVAHLVPTAPGLEHFRSIPDGHGRKPRPTAGPSSPTAHLARQWDRAVRRLSARGVVHDHTFDHRAGIVADHVELQFDRIASTPGRWASEHGDQDRDVLEELLLLGLEGVTLTVEAASRTLAIRIGFSHTTVQHALARLTVDGGWIARVEAGSGHRAHRWSLSPSTDPGGAVDNQLPQASPPPLLNGISRRDLMLRLLRQARSTVTQELFTYQGGLKRECAYVYREVKKGRGTLIELSEILGIPIAKVQILIDRLVDANAVTGEEEGWQANDPAVLTEEATRRGLHEHSVRRKKRYELEREQWAWWLAEIDWMSAPNRSSQKRRPGRGQLSMLPGGRSPIFVPYPRHPDGRADHSRARREIITSLETVVLENAA